MMVTDVQTFSFEGNQLAYRKMGTGPATLLAFHGFGQSSEAFTVLDISLENQFTIFAIDLFFHGESQYNTPDPLTKPAWHRLLAAFLAEHHIARFSLMGFSLGGRFALATVEAFASQIDQLILIAPDGITRNVWYRLATGSAAGRWLFQFVLHHLSLLVQIGQAVVWLGLLNRALLRFAEVTLITPYQRTQAYRSWTGFRQLQPDLQTIANLLNNNPIGVSFFTGASDHIVPGHYILPLTRQLSHYNLTVLPARHNQLIERTGATLATAGLPATTPQ